MLLSGTNSVQEDRPRDKACNILCLKGLYWQITLYINFFKQEIALLFEELDEDDDGKVSFEEFLHGLFVAKDTQEFPEEEPFLQDHSTPYSQPSTMPRMPSQRQKVCQYTPQIVLLESIKF